MRKLFSLIAAVLFAGSMMAADELKATLDFTGTAWNIPTSGTNTEAAQFTDGTYTITLEATNNYKQNSGYLILGKANSTLTLPAFEWKTTKICVTGTSGASESVKQNIFVGETAVSTETTGAKNVTNEYAIAADYQAAGNVYVLKVTSSHNTQISKIEVYTEGEGTEELSFDFKLENNILTITPSNNDPWAGMAIPTAVITEEFGTIEAFVDVVKDIQGTTTGKQSLDLTKLDPEEFPAGTECTFVAFGLVEGAVTTIASFEFVVPEPLADPTNCAEAAEAALSVSGNNVPYNGGKEYTIEGYVTGIKTAYSDQYHNITFWMADTKDGGEVLQAYRAACAAEADAPAVGDKVKVTGSLTKYNGTPQFAAACTFVITEKAEPVDENEVVKLGFNLPTENRPADNSIEIAGSFVEGTMALEKIEATGWFLSYDFVKAVADDTFKLRDKSNNDLILCKYNEGKAIWEQAIFTFGDYWKEDSWKGTPCMLIEEDLSNAAEYAWKEGAPEPGTEVVVDTITCAKAAEDALAGETYEAYVKGYVTEIAYAWKEGSMSFWMADAKDGGKVFEAYKCAVEKEEDAPGVGDLVLAHGNLTKYNTTPEFAAGCTVEILEKAEPVVEDGWAKILFTEPVAAADLAADAEFALLGSEFKVKITDPDNKMSIDANACRFGSAEEYVMYSHRLKTGGKTSGEKNFITATIPADGILRLAVRTGSNSDETRTLIVAQGADTLYNQVIRESMAVKVMEGETEVSVYPYVEVAVKAGAVALSYPVNGLNFYLFAFAEEAPALKDPTNCAEAAEAALSVSENNELYNDGKIYTIEGYVTEIAYAWSSSSKNMSFWMADTKDGGKVLEAYKCAIEKEEDAARVGDKVKVTGALTKYNTTPEFAAGCTVEIIERGEQPDPQNLGEKTIAEFLELKNTVDTCILTGAIDSLVNASYGNFNLVDETGKVYIYGLKDAEGNYCYEAKGLAEGDIITVLAIYSEYYGKPQVKNAIFVSKKSQGIDNTNVEIKVEKFFRDGQLIIRKNGIEYNVQGAVIK